MKKYSLFLSAIIVLAAFSFPTQAATIRGRVLEQAPPHNGLATYGSVTLYKKSGTSWVYTSTAHITTTNVSFLFKGLAAGTYSLRIEGYNYKTEYYNNTTVYENRTEITLAADTIRNVGDIYLNPLPIRLANASLSTHNVPAAGGRVIATFDVVNDTAADKELLVMIMLEAKRTIQNATIVSGELQGASKSVTVPAHSTVTATKAIDIPETVPAHTRFDVNLHLTQDKWWPQANPEFLGIIYKSP
ncbi:hypothetical protein [Syntrophobacter fumaroxidans]|uniref:Carboxypeptidase regulatory-like domain-containing protein n=1 Tax=Syntrophobacter fumaroxidans (strain DSM 10017 / MPOB) TaxID=335543 RepID=A0LG09_SYNFM|nr:hypothetical protein [Syntrophobacter fumaroxidans]ABK16361.1 hypothetical protein Sfum_0662 [Syntrophobacter fumaroxidans MPOB]